MESTLHQDTERWLSHSVTQLKMFRSEINITEHLNTKFINLSTQCYARSENELFKSCIS